MNWREKFSRFERFGTDWRRLLIRGVVLLFIGTILAIAAVFNPDANILGARDFSWLPIAGWVVLAVGILGCIDALIAKEVRDFFLHLPIGVLDTVVGGLTAFSLGDHPEHLSFMIAAFLISKGLIRMTYTRALPLPNPRSTLLGALASVILGVMAWREWFASAAWFLAFCLSVDIALRGWALLMFSRWVKERR